MVQGSNTWHSVKRLMRGLGLIIASPLLLLCALWTAVAGGPLLCWSCCFVRRWKEIFSQYDENTVVIGNIIDSKVVGGNDVTSVYGVTYSYQYKDAGHAGTCECSSQSFQRTRHYVKIPRSVDDFGPPPHRPADLEPGKPIRLVMIPGHPESALPFETLKKIKTESMIADSDIYACIIPADKSRKDKCVDFILQFFCFAWWFPFTCIAIGLWNLLPTDTALVLWPLLMCIMFLWWLLCLPISWWCHKKLSSDILAGGDCGSGVIDDLGDLSASPPSAQA